MATTKTKAELEEELKAARALLEEEEIKNEKLQEELKEATENAVAPAPAVEAEDEEDWESVTFKAKDGYELVGQPKFPFTTTDPVLIAVIRKSRAYRGGVVWEEHRSPEEIALAEKSLTGVSFDRLIKTARKLGIRFSKHMSKVDLLELIEKEGGR